MKKKLLAHRYLLIEEIGSGGMGTVYRATDRQTRADVAVKILHPHFRKERTYVERFRSEAEIARLLKSTHAVGVLDLGQDGDEHFIVMEYIKGESLSELLRRTGHLSLPDALTIALDVASALNEAHECLIVHRDIKPQNILVTPDGRAKVTDFGIARAGELTGLTSTGSLIGSVHYMAPEALAGQAEARSDIYSLGVVLYEMLIGTVPIQGETAYEVIKAHTEQLPQSLPAILFGQELDALVSSCLAKKPEDRPQSALEVAASIRNLLGQAEEIEEGRSRRKPSRRLGLGHVLLGLLLVLAGASAGFAFGGAFSDYARSSTSTPRTPSPIVGPTAKGGTGAEVPSNSLQPANLLDQITLTASECDPTQSDKYCVYTVRVGDTMSTIATAAGLKSTEDVANWELLVYSNKPDIISEDDPLQVGQKLRIPHGQGVVHTVLGNETLPDLADQYGTAVEGIMQANGIADINALMIGDELLIPNPKRFVSRVVIEGDARGGGLGR